MPILTVGIVANLCRFLTEVTMKTSEQFALNEQTMRDKFESNELTWADLLEITGLPAHVLYDILQDLI